MRASAAGAGGAGEDGDDTNWEHYDGIDANPNEAIQDPDRPVIDGRAYGDELREQPTARMPTKTSAQW